MIDSQRITIHPDRRGGKPCIRDMRITVYDVLQFMASGMSIEQILDEYPELEREDILACLAFAADREHRVTTLCAA
uniref:Uncharacterized conserved protein, DUF433 family n=1 Tax=Candidatus Kentrum sp. FM TaxID=2126340 RepID=A0A450SII1_9GAMM|nr:MAG: Uncharacterized conserved protein, DUF433 family [Candidatus Kentron sp. FM]VFJ60574.1 MAG: Uncharacterized conserved protein, DUF433 family [Candidatus Kentron sp. FM]VFK12993.1 MAG: Uncharacterized conserved protein, DUF433 family [Candidatus Kentron sp. FM]